MKHIIEQIETRLNGWRKTEDEEEKVTYAIRFDDMSEWADLVGYKGFYPSGSFITMGPRRVILGVNFIDKMDEQSKCWTITVTLSDKRKGHTLCKSVLEGFDWKFDEDILLDTNLEESLRGVIHDLGLGEKDGN